MDLSSLAFSFRSHLWLGDQLSSVDHSSLSTGFSELDNELPGGGWPTAALTEVLPQYEGIGELRLLAPVLSTLSKEGRQLIFVAPPYVPYAPSLQAAGVDLSQLSVVRTRSPREMLWTTEQALRSNACGAVVAWTMHIDYKELRRLQLAAEGGSALAVLFRPAYAIRENSPAALRLKLQTFKNNLEVHVLKRRGGVLSKPVLLKTTPTCFHASRVDSEQTSVTEQGRKVKHHVVDRSSFSEFTDRIVSRDYSFV